ncbi:MAG: hypothetical protein EA369_04495 [Bradymonadales bacterium]|nr:MAG: hypothetical protein EA369_04495 [Bradymonadales bacterium]
MRRFLQLGILGFFSLLLVELSAEEASWVECRTTDHLGLARQCSSVRVIQEAGPILRVYSLSQQRLLSRPTNQVFQTKEISAHEPISENQVLFLAEKHISSLAHDESQVLCRSLEDSLSEHIQIDCGQSRPLSVHRAYLKRAIHSFKEKQAAEEALRIQGLNAAAQPPKK